MLDYLWNVPRDIWIFKVSNDMNFFAESVGAFQTVGIVLVTAMIPFGMAIVQELISKRKDYKFPNLDLHTILSEVIPAKKILIIFALVFLSPIFWRISGMSNWFNILFITLWGIGIAGLIWIFSNLFHWIKSDNRKTKLRRNYLNKLAETKKWENKGRIWTEVFKNKELERDECSYFLSPFIKTMRELLRNKKEGEWNGLLEMFFGAYENLDRAINRDGCQSVTDEHFFRISIELLMRKYEQSPEGSYFWPETIESRSDELGVEALKNKIKKLQKSSPEKQKNYEEFSSGKVLDTCNRGKTVYELPEEKKAGWAKLFEDKK